MGSKKRWKDRRDGKYLYDLDSMHKMLPYMMPSRADCESYLQISVDTTNLMDYVSKKKAEGDNSISLFSTMIATTSRVFAMKPRMNRFICGYRYYQRQSFDVGFVARRQYTEKSEEEVIRMSFGPEETIYQVSDKLYSKINCTRNKKPEDGFDAVRAIAKLPRMTGRLLFSYLRFMNFYGKAPKFLIEDDPNFASIFITNMGSINGGAPFHHLNEWGTNSVFMCVSKIEDRPCVVDGEIVVRPMMDLAFTVDERIADGFYFTRALEKFEEIFKDPSVLEQPYVPVEAE